MTELWSDDDEKTQLAGEIDGDHKQTVAHRGGGVVSQMDMQDRDPYAYHPRYDNTFSESSPDNNLKTKFDDNAPITYPQRSRGPQAAPPVSYVPPDPTTPRSSPPPRPGWNIARRSRAPVWEMVSTDQDQSQEYYVGGPGGAVVKRVPSTGVANLSPRRSSKSNLHPILQNFSSPISTCPFL
jgi:hypothetical protein